MKYAIDAHYRDVIRAILSICNDEFAQWENEGEYGDCKYQEIDEYGKTYGNILSLYSSANRYFNFEETIFKINKNQSPFTVSIVEEIDFSDAQWNFGESKDITWIMDRICQVLNRDCYYGPFEYYTDQTDDFYTLQEKYEIYIPPTLTR